MLKFDDRFARQNRYEPPPEFPLASPYSSIVHHLSGPTGYATPQIQSLNELGSGDVAPLLKGITPKITFITRRGLPPKHLHIR